MIIGLDIHGVIDTDPKFFAKLTKCLRLNHHEVYIITGVEHNARLDKELIRFGVQFDSIFSITSYHKDLGTPIEYKKGDLTQPMIDDKLWDMTKAQYCDKWGVDIHIDDLSIYGKYFNTISTQYMLYNDVVKEWLNFLTTGVK